MPRSPQRFILRGGTNLFLDGFQPFQPFGHHLFPFCRTFFFHFFIKVEYSIFFLANVTSPLWSVVGNFLAIHFTVPVHNIGLNLNEHRF